MARSRNIKPGFFTNADLLECDPLTRILFAGLWCEADRRGILEDRPKTLKIKILPGDNCDVNAMLDDLAERGFVIRYQIGEVRCLFIPNFHKHQNPHQNEKPNSLPAPEQYKSALGSEPEQNKSNRADSLNMIPDSLLLIPDSGFLIDDSLSSGLERVSEGGVGETIAGKPAHTQPQPDPLPAEQKPKRNHRLPPDWQPSEGDLNWAAEKGFDQSLVTAETEKFCNHFLGNGKAYQDWSRTWHNWMLRAAEGLYSARAPTAYNGRPPIRAVTAEYESNMARLMEIAKGG